MKVTPFLFYSYMVILFFVGFYCFWVYLFANFQTKLDKRTKKKDGTFPIKINITSNRKTVFINTGFSSLEEHWENSQFLDKNVW